MNTTRIRFPKYFPIINLYLFILGKTIKPVLLLNSEQIIPEKNKHAANKVMNEIKFKPPLKNCACVFDKKKSGNSCKI
jgi:hypothetical protein